ncbi:hypothetical protein QVD17_24344 [Tagetes erecta]|uniref:Uncharacterized protein n=1 Tax=Tagetes erecta TaxID=13708 RepID=A0AAD8KFI9_TARER|nr:hypothetical protein QVD17_24344 [Tagetes erecta]
MSDYNTWSEHGEPSIREVGQSSTTREVVSEVDDDDGGCRRMVLDNMYSFEFTTPLHSNMDSTTSEGHVPNLEGKGFYDMLKASYEPLWEGEKAIECSNTDSRLSIFKYPSRRLSDKGGKLIVLDADVQLKVIGDPQKEHLREIAQGPLTYTAPRGVYELAEDSSEVGDEGNEDEEHVFQDNERLVSTETTSDDDLLPITHVHEAIVKEVNNINDDDGVEAEFEDTSLDDDNVEEFEYSDSD